MASTGVAPTSKGRAPSPWDVLTTNVTPCDLHTSPKAGDVLLILESMKMEIPLESPESGRVAELRVAPEDSVEEGQVLVVLDT